MDGNECNIIRGKSQTEGDHLREDSNKFNALKSETISNNELPQHVNVNEKNNRRNSQDSMQVKFKGVDDKDSIDSELPEKKLPPIPDGGWGWVVVFAAFLTSVCSDGLAYSFGILHDEFIRYFGESQAKTSWIGSLFIAVPLISGPIMSALIERFGCRTTTMVASVVSTGGFLLAAISNSVELLCVTLGIISGLSMGILYVTSVVSVAFWFDKKRTLAVSIASCGIGFGTLIYSPLTNFFLQNYDWRNTLVLLSGTVLNMCVCGALMREPDWVIIKDKREAQQKKAKKAKLKKSSSLGSISVKSVGGESIVLGLNELNELVKSGHSPEYVLSILTSALAESKELEEITQMNAEMTHKRNHSVVDLPTFIHQNEPVPPEVMANIMENRNLYSIILQNYPHRITRKPSEVNFGIGGASRKSSNDSGLHPSSLKAISPQSTLKHKSEELDLKSVGVIPKLENKLKNVDIDLNNNMVHPKDKKVDQLVTKGLALYRNPVVNRRALMDIPQHKLRSASLPDIYKNSAASIWSKSEDEKKWYDPVVKVLKKNFNFNLFTEFHFLMFSITSLLMSVWSIIPFFFLKSYMTDLAIEGAPTVMSIIGIANGIGIIVLGWFGDRPWFNVTKAYAVLLALCGVAVAVYPFVINNFPLLIAVSIVFGVSFASTYSYTPAILIELVPIDHFTSGYGMVLLCQGVGNLIGPPIGGLLFDISESWDLTFYVGGGFLVISGLCVATIAYIKNVRIIGKETLLLDAEKLKNQDAGNNV
ncbi:monocarboxylate transporter 9-like [Epargyreus clarus]|uniref:monocarboxylate transporter 9-like n=1 Tax=Epargyreus clarus TaxID=520877 RepID=UPI003C2EC14C